MIQGLRHGGCDSSAGDVSWECSRALAASRSDSPMAVLRYFGFGFDGHVRGVVVVVVVHGAVLLQEVAEAKVGHHS